jgi:chorismate mutase
LSADIQQPVRLRGVRGATRPANADPDAIRSATRDLLHEILRRNSVAPAAVVSAVFTVTSDLTTEFPARAAREIGWNDVAMLCCTEIPVPGAMDRVIRVLVHVELPANSSARHVYLNGAEDLRPDL